MYIHQLLFTIYTKSYNSTIVPMLISSALRKKLKQAVFVCMSQNLPYMQFVI